MSWVPSKKRFAQFAVAAMLLGEASYVSAQVLILRAVGPSARRYRPGTRVANDATFTLRPSDSVVILSRGRTRTFRGPGVYRANQPISRTLYASNYARRSGTGAVRSAEGEMGPTPRPTDVWQVDIATAGRACFLPGSRPTLWRANPAQPARVTITPQTGAPQTVNWPAGQTTAQWPASIPVTDGAVYRFAWGTGAPTQITAVVLSGVARGDDEALAATLQERGCDRQLGVYIATHPDPIDDQPAP